MLRLRSINPFHRLSFLSVSSMPSMSPPQQISAHPQRTQHAEGQSETSRGMRTDHTKLRKPMAQSTRRMTLNRGLWRRSCTHGECFLALGKACSEYRHPLLIVQGSRDVACLNRYSILKTADEFGERLIISRSLADRPDWTRL